MKSLSQFEIKGEAKGIKKGANLLAELIKQGYDVNTALEMITKGT